MKSEVIKEKKIKLKTCSQIERGVEVLFDEVKKITWLGSNIKYNFNNLF